MACDVRVLSEPPRRITALPDLSVSAPASAVTLGRLSKITPMTPSGVRTREMSSPLGRSHCGHHRSDRIGQGGDLAQALRRCLRGAWVEPSAGRETRPRYRVLSRVRCPRHWRRGLSASRRHHGVGGGGQREVLGIGRGEGEDAAALRARWPMADIIARISVSIAFIAPLPPSPSAPPYCHGGRVPSARQAPASRRRGWSSCP